MSFLKSSSAVLSAPSPTPSNGSSSGTKRKRPAEGMKAATSTIFSQPLETGTGTHILTQVQYTVDHLKEVGRALSFDEIAAYLGPQVGNDNQDRLRGIFQAGGAERIAYNVKTGKYSYRPKSSVKTPEELKGFLQNQKSARGIAVKDLKDGWPNASEAIEAMEKKKELLVTHNKKDGSARTVWINDPTLMHKLDGDFLGTWHTIQLPANPDELRMKLVAAGLNPSSAPKEIVAAKPKEKKKKAPRKGGKQTNTHMAAILKDYSHKRN